MTAATLTRAASAMKTMTLVRAGEMLDRTFVLPLLIFYATSRCNSRCVSCDWWKSSGADDLTLDEIARVAAALPKLGTRVVVFSGGEPLLRPDVFAAADLFASRGARLHLLTSGVLLERVVGEVASRFERVTISLDAATDEQYRAIRGIPALKAVEAGVAALRKQAPALTITARSTLHRHNFRDLAALIHRAKQMGVDAISFLAADVSSSAFGRESGANRHASLGLTEREVVELADAIEQAIEQHSADIASGFIVESAEKLRRIARHYAAMAAITDFSPVSCNAPSISVVLEADGRVRPCFFHEPIGSVRTRPFAEIVLEELPAFRSGLDTATNPVCARCVCSIKAGWRRAPWH